MKDKNNINDFYLRDINLLTIFFGNVYNLKYIHSRQQPEY